MKKINLTLTLIIAFFIFGTKTSFGQKQDTLETKRYGKDQKYDLGQQNLITLENFTICSKSTKVVNFDRISIFFDFTQFLSVKNMQVLVLEGDSLENVFASWVTQTEPLGLISSGFDYILNPNQTKKFCLVIRNSNIVLPNELSATILLTGFDNAGQEVVLEVKTHKIYFAKM